MTGYDYDELDLFDQEVDPPPCGALIDLVKFIELAVEQVHGSDERAILSQFLERNTEGQYILLDLGDLKDVIVQLSDTHTTVRLADEGR